MGKVECRYLVRHLCTEGLRRRVRVSSAGSCRLLAQAAHSTGVVWSALIYGGPPGLQAALLGTFYTQSLSLAPSLQELPDRLFECSRYPFAPTGPVSPVFPLFPPGGQGEASVVLPPSLTSSLAE